MVRDFHSNSTKWTISSQTGPVSYVINMGMGMKWKRHVEHIRAYSPSTASEHIADTTPDDGIVDLNNFWNWSQILVNHLILMKNNVATHSVSECNQIDICKQ